MWAYHSSEQRQGESFRQMVLQCWKSVCWRKFVWMGHAAVAQTMIAMTACYFESWCVDWDIPALTSDVSCRSGRPVCSWCTAPLVANAAPAAASWREIASAPAVRLSRRCSALAAASDGAGWSAVKHSVAVVDSRENQTKCKRMCWVHCQ